MFEESLYTLYHIHYNVDSDKASYHNRAVKRGEHMPGEKEININLLNMLDLLERLEMANNDGGYEKLKEQIAF